ncbi:MAG: PAS domain-containing protein [Vicinamibacterales bacterium]
MKLMRSDPATRDGESRASRLLRAAAPTVLVLFALWAQYALRPVVGPRRSLLIYPAVAFGALYGGKWPGIVATVVATLGVWFVFNEPVGTLGFRRSEDIVGVIVFAAIGLLFNLVAARLRHAAARDREAEARQRVHEATERSERQFRLIADAIPILISRVDREGRYLYVNAAYAAFVGRQPYEIQGLTKAEVLGDAAKVRVDVHMARALQGHSVTFEEEVSIAGRPPRHLVTTYVPELKDGLVTGFFVAGVDTTERHQADERLEKIVASVPGGICVWRSRPDGTHCIPYASSGFARIFDGLPIDELKHDAGPLLARIHPDDVERVIRSVAESATTLKPWRCEYRVFTRRGETWVDGRSIPSREPDGSVLWYGVVVDITATKQVESALHASEAALRTLSAKLLTAQEDERRSLARELHDAVTQQLALMSIEIGTLVASLPLPAEDVGRRLRALQERTIQIAREVRTVSHGLHPSTLEELGLCAALESICEDVNRNQGLMVSYTGVVDDSDITPQTAASIFRIAQECLGNAAKHACATEVGVELCRHNDTVTLRVRDNGVGFSAETTTGQEGLGILSMKERMRLVNGTLTLKSQPGVGTTVEAVVPLGKEAREAAAYPAG